MNVGAGFDCPRHCQICPCQICLGVCIKEPSINQRAEIVHNLPLVPNICRWILELFYFRLVPHRIKPQLDPLEQVPLLAAGNDPISAGRMLQGSPGSTRVTVG